MGAIAGALGALVVRTLLFRDNESRLTKGLLQALVEKERVGGGPLQQLIGYIVMMMVVTFNGPFLLSHVVCNMNKYYADIPLNNTIPYDPIFDQS